MREFDADDQKHPFTLCGIDDPSAWLASTDPHAQTFVTVSNDEVAAVVIKSSSFRDRFRKGIKTISHKLQIFGSARNRSRSIGDADSAHTSGTSGQSSTAVSQTNLVHLARKGTSASREASPLTSPSMGGSISRRLSVFGHRPDIPSPRRASSQLPTPPFGHAPEMSSRSVSSQSGSRGFVVHRPQTHAPFPILKPDAIVPLSDSVRPSPRTIASTGSIDMLRNNPDASPVGSLQRRRSSDIDSNTSSGIGHRVINFLTLNRSLSRPRTVRSEDGRSDPTRTQSTDAMSAESVGRQSPEPDSLSTESHRIDRHWGRLEDTAPVRRDSSLGEAYQPVQPAVVETSEDDDSSNEVDWVGDGNISDGDDYDPDGLVIAPSLDPIPDISPLTMSTPPRQGSPRSNNPNSPGRASSSPRSWAWQGDRARSPLRPADRELESHAAGAVHEGEVSIVSKRSRKGSVAQ